MPAVAAPGTTSPNSSSSNAAATPECLSTPSARCTFTTADDRRCTAFVFPGHSSLCHQHLRQLLNHLPQSEDVAFDILSSIHNFQSAAAINAALGKIFALLAAGRIKRRDAIAMSYICQLLLQSLKGFEQEMGMTTYRNTWMGDLLDILNARAPLTDFIFPADSRQQSDEPDSEVSSEEFDSEESPEDDSEKSAQDEDSQDSSDDAQPEAQSGSKAQLAPDSNADALDPDESSVNDANTDALTRDERSQRQSSDTNLVDRSGHDPSQENTEDIEENAQHHAAQHHRNNPKKELVSP